MSTKFFSDGEIHAYFNPYESPYDAYINYMNVLSDFSIRLNALVPETNTDQEVVSLSKIIDEKQELILKYENELKRLRSSKAKIASVQAGPSAMKTTQPARVKKVLKKSLKKTKPGPAKKVTAKKITPKKVTLKNVKKTTRVKKNK